MSCSIKLVRLDDFIADVDSIDLAANGYALAEDGYFPTVAPIGAKSVLETITLKLQGTSKDDLAAMTQEINDKIRQVQWWIEDPGIERYQVWIRVQQENETYARQAMILNIVPPENVRLFTPEEINQNYIGEYQIGIERTPFWEDPYAYPTTTGSTNTIGTLGGTWTLSETINGDVPARLARITMTPESSTYLADFWMGWKTSRFGTVANFVPVWSLDKYTTTGTGLDTDTSKVIDATAYDGKNITTTFATVATLTQRVLIRTDDVTANYADQRGTYNVLLRAKMSDTSVARARIGFSFVNIGLLNPVYRSRQVISGTDWKLYEMGTVSIPPQRIYSGYSLNNFAIAIEAERLSGSGNLLMDCLTLIPIDDGALKLTTSDDLSAGIYACAFQSANDQIATFAETSNVVIRSMIAQPVHWSLPANGNSPTLIFAGQGRNLNKSILGQTVDMAYTYIPRWRTLRGNDT